MKPNQKQIKVIDNIIRKLEMLKYNDIHTLKTEGELRDRLECELYKDVDGILNREVMNFSNILGRLIYSIRQM